MKVLVVGDVHWSEYSSIIRKRGDKYSKRLENLINSLNWVEDLAEQQGVDKVIFLGDFFDKQTLNASEISALQEVIWSNIPHDFIVGNHEGLNEALDISSAHIFKLIPNARVIDEPIFDCGFGYQFLYLPYCKEEDRKSIKYWKDYFTSGYWTTQEVKHTIVFSHNDVKIQYGLMPATIGYELEDIDANCTYFLNGHLHNGGKFSSKGYNIGNLTGQNFGEDATKYSHCVALLNTDNPIQLNFIENPYAFNFYKIEIKSSIDELNLNNIKDNSVITVKSPESLVSEVRQLLEDYQDKVKEFRIIAIPNRQLSEEGKDETVIESVNHLEEFVSFVKSNLTMTPSVVEELSIICK